MRKTIPLILIALSLAGAAAAVEHRRRADEREKQDFSRAREARAAIERMVRIRAATLPQETNQRGWPDAVDPDWFGPNPPLNPFVGLDHPWIEIASPGEAELTDPVIRQALTPDIAAFWYNPASGAVRLRVGRSVVDAHAIDLYNRINDASIDTLFGGGITERLAEVNARPQRPHWPDRRRR